jgi:riboflavin biosynthesis pyrimidine reductase
VDQFEAFVRRKEGEAVSAVLPPYETAFSDPPHDAVAIGNRWTRTLFDGDFYLSPASDPGRPACSLVFVQSREGNTGARNPSALGGGDTDKHLIYEGLSRVAADAAMAGAGTARGGRTVFSVWHPELVQLRRSLGKPRHPVQIVATLQGIDVEHEMLFNAPDIRVVLLTVPSCRTLVSAALSARPWVSTVVMDSPDRLDHAFRRMRDLGIERISCIGGRQLATQLLDEGLVQDLYLTTSPTSGGDQNTPLYSKPLNGRPLVRKRGSGTESGVLFEHIQLRKP